MYAKTTESEGGRRDEWRRRQRWTQARLGELPGMHGLRRRSAEEAIVLRHLDLVDGIVRRMASGYREQGDLRQVGCIGLVHAVRRYDPERGDSFLAFAVPTISGEIKRYLRDSGWFVRPPRRLQEVAARASDASEELAQRLGREPRVGDVADALGLTPQLVAEALGARENMRPVSLDLALDEDDDPLIGSLGALDEHLERADLRLALRSALGRLTPRERRIVYLRFIEERTQREISAEVGVTQMQVSRLLTGILRRLRSELDGGQPVRTIDEPARAVRPRPATAVAA
jgi:RNA polymerase sigma-B factor